MKDTYLNFKLNKVMERNLETACEKLGMSRSDTGRLGLWMLFDAYLSPEELGKESNSRPVFTKAEIEVLAEIVKNTINKEVTNGARI